MGRIWADTASSIPQAPGASKYYVRYHIFLSNWRPILTLPNIRKLKLSSGRLEIQMKPRTIPRWNKFFDEVVDITSKRAKKRERRRLRAMEAAGTGLFDVHVNEQQHVLLSLMSEYYDMMYCARTHENAVSVMSAYASHALNHVLKTRDLILKHNNILSQFSLAQKDKKKGSGPKEEAPEFRDQGFTRPKVLVILPMRNSCLEFVDLLLQLAPKTQADRVANKNKFYEEFFDELYEPKADKPRTFFRAALSFYDSLY